MLELPSIAGHVVGIRICINAFGGLRLQLLAGIFKVQMPQSRKSTAAGTSRAAISNRRVCRATVTEAEKSEKCHNFWQAAS